MHTYSFIYIGFTFFDTVPFRYLHFQVYQIFSIITQSSIDDISIQNAIINHPKQQGNPWALK